MVKLFFHFFLKKSFCFGHPVANSSHCVCICILFNLADFNSYSKNHEIEYLIIFRFWGKPVFPFFSQKLFSFRSSSSHVESLSVYLDFGWPPRLQFILKVWLLLLISCVSVCTALRTFEVSISGISVPISIIPPMLVSGNLKSILTHLLSIPEVLAHS